MGDSKIRLQRLLECTGDCLKELDGGGRWNKLHVSLHMAEKVHRALATDSASNPLARVFVL